MSGHGIIAVATIAPERGIIVPGGDGPPLVLGRASRHGSRVVDRGAGRKDRARDLPPTLSLVMHGGIDVAPARDASEPTSRLAVRFTQSSTANLSACRSMRRMSPSSAGPASRSRMRSIAR